MKRMILLKNNGFSNQMVRNTIETIKSLYFEDGIPWVVGYSGGKDSTATLQLVWFALRELSSEEKKHKPVHVISTDTLVESPVISHWVIRSLKKMEKHAKKESLPIQVHSLKPAINNTFWVNLIGRGYPAPSNLFRWCTSRLKIEPSNNFVKEMVARHGEAILVLGTRKAESKQRAKIMEKYAQKRVRDLLSPSGSLPNSLVFSPIESWSNDDVWMLLMQYMNPWEQSNKELLSMYRGASTEGECPLVVDTTTPSCGSSRFGCWVCTLVSEDKSMAAMIQNDEEKEWMYPLLKLRNELADSEKDRERRDFRRMDGSLLYFKNRLVHGPYTKKSREYWLKRVLQIEEQLKEYGPEEFNNLKLILDDELREIRKIWLFDKHEFDDSLPRIYEEVRGKEFPYYDDVSTGPFGKEEWDILKDLCKDEDILFELQTSLVDIAQRNRLLSSRQKALKSIEEKIKRSFFTNEEDAEEMARKRFEKKNKIEGKLFDLGGGTSK